jgi:hypothetical protein
MPLKHNHGDAGTLSYVVLRGGGKLKSRLHRGQAGEWSRLFLDNAERKFFCQRLASALSSSRTRLHAFSLTPYDVRLLVETTEISVGAFAQRLCTSYSVWTNKRRGRSAELFQQRYVSVSVRDGPTIQEAVRHIHRAPLAAGQTKVLSQYRWSSHRTYLSKESTPWLTTHRVLSLFKSYPRDILAASSSESSEFIPGDSEFIDWLKEKVTQDTRPATLEQLIEATCIRLKCTRRDLLSKSSVGYLPLGRALVARLASDWLVATYAQVAAVLGHHRCALHQAAQYYGRRYPKIFRMPLFDFLNTTVVTIQLPLKCRVEPKRRRRPSPEMSDAQIGARLARALKPPRRRTSVYPDA